MTIEVNTGGLKKFVYPKNHKVKRDYELEMDLEEGHRQADKRIKRNRIIKWSIIILIVIVVGSYFLLR